MYTKIVAGIQCLHCSKKFTIKNMNSRDNLNQHVQGKHGRAVKAKCGYRLI